MTKQASSKVETPIVRMGADKRSRRTILLTGKSKTGKTHQFRTLCEAGLKPLYVTVERKASTIADLDFDVWPIRNVAFPLSADEKADILASDNGQESVIALLDYLRREPHTYDFVYFDSMMRYCFKSLEHLLATTYSEKDGNTHKLDGRRAYGLFGRKTKLMLDLFADVADVTAKHPAHFIATWGTDASDRLIVGGQIVDENTVAFHFEDVYHLELLEDDDGVRKHVMHTKGNERYLAGYSAPVGVRLDDTIVEPSLYDVITTLQGGA